MFVLFHQTYLFNGNFTYYEYLRVYLTVFFRHYFLLNDKEFFLKIAFTFLFFFFVLDVPDNSTFFLFCQSNFLRYYLYLIVLNVRWYHVFFFDLIIYKLFFFCLETITKNYFEERYLLVPLFIL